MKGRKLFEVLRLFSRKEMKALADFVNSPYFNKNQHLIAFTHYLLTAHPTFDEKTLELTLLPPTLVPGEALTEKKVSYLISGVYRLTEQYLIHSQVRTNNNLAEFHLINRLLEIGALEISYAKIQKFKKQLAQPKQYDLEQITLYYLVSDLAASLLPGRVADRNIFLQESIEGLFDLYQTNILRYAYEAVSRRYVVSTEGASLPFIEEVEQLSTQDRPSNPIAEIYLGLYRMSKKPEDEQLFDHLLTLLKKNEEKIGLRDLKNIYLSMINLSVRMMRRSPKKYTPVTLYLYMRGIDQGVLTERGELSQWTFTNTVKLALRAHQYTWAENFIQNYHAMIPMADRRNALSLNQAELAFAKGSPAEALDYLQLIKTGTVRYHIFENLLRIKCLWVTAEYNTALAALAAFKVYLSRATNVAPAIKKSCQNFCQILHRISSMASQKKQKTTHEKILNTRLLAEKEWLHQVFLEKRDS